MQTLFLAALAAVAVAGSAGASTHNCNAVALRAAPVLDDRGAHMGLQVGDKTGKLTQLVRYRGGYDLLCQDRGVCYYASDLKLLNCHVDNKLVEQDRWRNFYDLKP